jgi:hypothetical protein
MPEHAQSYVKNPVNKFILFNQKNNMNVNNPPLTFFTGTLRQITPMSLNELGATMLHLCAPLFAPIKTEQRDEIWKWHVEKHGLDPNVNFWHVPTRQGRRFSGDLFPDEDEEYRLNAGCYHSICIDSKGYDNDTLVNELNAYRNPSTEFYTLFFDCQGKFAESLGMARSPHIGLLVYPADKLLQALPSSISKESRSLIDKASAAGKPFAITLGCVLSDAKIDGVLDLRQLQAQRWFFDTYVPKGPFPTNASDFVGILPELTKLNLGSWSENNRRTHIIGADLRARGVSALIFPSARSNVYVDTKQGQIITSGGWNIVRYLSSKSLRKFEHHDSGGWLTEFPYSQIRVNRKVNKIGEETGWEIEGLMDINMFLYENKMAKKDLGIKNLLKLIFSSN